MALDFSKLPYDVSKPGALVDYYPELRDYFIFSNEEDDIYLKLTVLITDENSPFVRKHKEFSGIVTDACDYLGIEDRDFIQQLILGDLVSIEVNKVFKMQDMYFRIQNKWEYNTWYDLMYQYHENSLVLRTPLNPAAKDYEKRSEIKQKIRVHQIQLQKDLIAYENLIFPTHTNIKKVVTEQVSKITNFPERMAIEYLGPQ